ncbi:hypothetical protein JIG36_27945 [Actinoplanes sp. LDG1-06]|uniref:GNAT family N-acetyltransferase n=1 Tax=Paractinoplanes ovalisporus TaxID=2810368 RepID=A0ABS2AHS4_9ACTN|nr:hypothetical protein [Actinoplanes ovalisporus]MBM2619391.1 hypothetical protein [Actinoplanes ovalisporus]
MIVRTATLSDAPIRQALLSFADDLAEYASDATVAGPPRIFPEGEQIAKVCDLQTRIEVKPIRPA